MSGNSPQRDLINGPVVRTLLLFALPALGVNILQSINGSVNAIWVGRILGEGALAATSNATLVMFLVFSAIFGFATAATILIGQSMGRGDVDGVRRIVGGSMGLFLFVGVITAIAGWIFTPPLLRLMATPPEAYDLAVTYLRVIFLAMPPFFVMILTTSALRGVGDSTTPLWSTVLNVAVCIVINPMLIMGIGPFPKLGIAGSAWATMIAVLISGSYLMWRIYQKDLSIRLRGAELSYLLPNRATVSALVKIGFPIGLSMIVMTLSGLMMVGLINREGVNTAAAYGVMSQLWNYVVMPGVAVGFAVSAMVAQNIGANRWDRVNRIAWAGIGLNIIMQFVIIGAIALAIRPLLGLFLKAGSPAIDIAVHMNNVIGWTYIALGASMVAVSVVRSNGAVFIPLLFLTVSMIFVRLGVGFYYYPEYGADAIWWAFGISALFSLTLSVSYLKFGRWRDLKPLGAAPDINIVTEPAVGANANR